jgi:hypothetical protein
MRGIHNRRASNIAFALDEISPERNLRNHLDGGH